MNFVDAAVALLRENSQPMHVEELCRLALERGLLDSPGQSPLRSLKGRLTTELKRGPESRVVRLEDDLWALSAAKENGKGAQPAHAIEEEAHAAAANGPADQDGLDADAIRADANEDAAASVERGHDEAGLGDEAILGDEDEDDDEEEDAEDEDDDEEDILDEGAEDEVDPEEDAEDDDEDDEDDVEDVAAEPAEPRPTLSPEEEELAAVYAGETDTAQVGALSEYRDSQTADEDRPMRPEILPERRSRGREGREDWKARRDRMRDQRRERRDGRDKNKGGGASKGGQPAAGSTGAPAGSSTAPAAREPRAERGEPIEPSVDAEATGRPSSSDADLARRACEVLASIKGGQPVPVKQLAQMMRKRRLVDGDPERVWRPLKSALLADTQRRAAAGLPARVAYRGRDLFAYRPGANAELEAAELAVEAAAQRLRGATERALAARLAELSLAPLEQIAHLYLAQTGWRELEWIKRVDRSGYAVAREPGDGQLVMIGVRAGNQEVDRRGVGELRAGVVAKDLARGVLFAPRELGAEARAEMEKPGKPVSALTGLPWASALAQIGIGVALRAMTVAYLDGELLDRMTES